MSTFTKNPFSIPSWNHLAILVLLGVIVSIVFTNPAWASCKCKATLSVTSDSGDITVTRVRVASLQDLFGGTYLVLPYATKWKGSKKIRPNHRHTFSFDVSSNCRDGLRNFAFKRKDGKICEGYYPTGDDYDLCGVNTKSFDRAAPVITCGPSDWH